VADVDMTAAEPAVSHVIAHNPKEPVSCCGPSGRATATSRPWGRAGRGHGASASRRLAARGGAWEHSRHAAGGRRGASHPRSSTPLHRATRPRQPRHQAPGTQPGWVADPPPPPPQEYSCKKIRDFLHSHTAYELIPESGKVVLLDVDLPVRQVGSWDGWPGGVGGAEVLDQSELCRWLLVTPAVALGLALAAGCWLLAAGCWLLAAGCWLLAAGCWLLPLLPELCRCAGRCLRPGPQRAHADPHHAHTRRACPLLFTPLTPLTPLPRPGPQAFHALHEQGATSAPLWDSQEGTIIGVISASDFIHILTRLKHDITSGANPLSEVRRPSPPPPKKKCPQAEAAARALHAVRCLMRPPPQRAAPVPRPPGPTRARAAPQAEMDAHTIRGMREEAALAGRASKALVHVLPDDDLGRVVRGRGRGGWGGAEGSCAAAAAPDQRRRHAGTGRAPAEAGICPGASERAREGRGTRACPAGAA
jgi:hypothetical protein